VDEGAAGMKVKNIPNLNILWSSLLIEELIRNGVEYFCLSSGSRCAPLALAVAQNPKAKAFVHFDERAMAFHALGYASATGKPVVIITTSGTAVANVFPAVIEASKKKLPLIILTADRPPELRFTGAHQTIDYQPGIFGAFVRWSGDLPCPAQEISPAFVLTTIDQALRKTGTDVKGPAHLNCAFREPLGTQRTHKDFSAYLKPLAVWAKSGQPFTRYAAAKPSVESLNEVADALRGAKSGVIAAGKLGAEDRKAVVVLSEKLGWPIFPDVTSGLRLSAHHKNIIPHFDQILLNGKFVKSFKPDCVIQFGGRMTSKRLGQWLESSPPQSYIMVLNHSLRNDPSHQVTHRVQASAKDFVNAILKNKFKSASSALINHLRRLNAAVEDRIEQYFNQDSTLNEIRAVRLISQLVPAVTNLFLGNSMPIRDVEMFAVADRKDVNVTANRGASGIDGNIASAAGYCAGSAKLTTVVIGDLAFLHDLNALSMIKDLSYPVILVVMNNRGGGIFSFLPVAENNPHFEKFWGTPHDYNFSNAAAQFGLRYASAATTDEFTSAYCSAVQSGHSMVIEVQSDRQENVKEHRKLQERIKKVLN